jgi:hypothetical protein
MRAKEPGDREYFPTNRAPYRVGPGDDAMRTIGSLDELAALRRGRALSGVRHRFEPGVGGITTYW